MTYALRAARYAAQTALPALMYSLACSGCPECPGIHSLPVHDPFHARQDSRSRCVTGNDGSLGVSPVLDAGPGQAEGPSAVAMMMMCHRASARMLLGASAWRCLICAKLA
jgi:hypothetical protein